MTIEDKLLLIKAGYTKADIESMEGAAKPEPKPKQEPAPEPPKKEDPITLTWDQLTQLINKSATPAPTPTPTPAPATMTPEQYSQLLQAINRGNANIDMPPTSEATVENMLANRLKDAFTSTNREEENK